MDLQELRQQIDEIDNQMLELLNKRVEVVKKVGELKRATNTIIYRPEREKAIIDRLAAMNQGRTLNRLAIEAIYLEIFAVSRNIELPERISFLGPEGSFTHQAAESRFGAMSEYISLPSIRSVFESVDTGRVRFGVVPIENNREGIVNETIDLLYELDVKIVAEVLLPIHHTFATKCASLGDIKRVYSKDIAFRQCQRFLNEYLDVQQVELIPIESTSKAARMVASEPNSAAICSHIAAKLFGVPILFENIEDGQYNRTRFLIISKDFTNQNTGQDKTSLVVDLPEKPGSLASFLQEFNERQINLTKIESRPTRADEKFRSWFYIDFDGHIEDGKVQEILQKHASHVKWLGSYLKLS
jgi:chorismate mutase / prephenate dehydratase